MPAQAVEQAIGRVAALADPVRRALYFYVARNAQDGAVSRDQAARGVRITRALAAFHLDKLVEQGLLEATYRRLTKRRGPGAGRPAKLYRRAREPIAVSLPPREYELAARLFAGSLEDAAGPVPARVLKTTRAFGARLGRTARHAAGPRPTRRALQQEIQGILVAHGYEPFTSATGEIRQRKCPFDALAREYRPLMCGMNQALLAGVVRGVGLPKCRAVLDPQPGMCCVALISNSPRASGSR